MRVHNKQLRRAYKDYYKDKDQRIINLREQMETEHPLLFKQFN